MAIELKDLIELTGYTMPAKTEDFNMADFKKYFTSKFISLDAIEDNEDIVKKITGKRMGIIETRLSQAFSLKPSDTRDLKIEQIIEKAAGAYNKKAEEMVQQLQDKDKELNGYKTHAEETKAEYDKFKLVADTNFKNYKINDKLAKALSVVPFIDGFDDDAVRKANFNTVVKSKYQFDLDDNDELVVKDTRGHYIKHPADAAKIATPVDILTLEANANKLLKKNNARAIYNTRTSSESAGAGQGPKFKVNPRAQARLDSKA